MKGSEGAPEGAKVNQSALHDALIKLIPIQAQKVRHRLSQNQTAPHTTPTSPSNRVSDPQTPKPKKGGKGIRWEDDEISKQKELELKQQEENDRLWANNCEARAKACEDKLLQLLGEQSHLQSPSAARIAACMEVLGEVCVNCPPFSHVLNNIMRELQLALFCPAVNKDESVVKVPYFEIVEHLDNEIRKKEMHDTDWTSSIHECQNHIEDIEEDHQSLANQVKNADLLNKNLDASLASASNSVEVANEQVTKSRQNLIDLKKEIKVCKAEIRKSKSLRSQMEHEDELAAQEQLRVKYAQLMNEQQHYYSFLESAQNQLEECVPRADYLSMKAQMLELQQRLADIQAKSIKITYETKHLTPRPDWDAAPGLDTTLSTLQKAAEICRQNASLSNKLAILQSEWTDTNVALAEANEKFKKVTTQQQNK